jgi:hypothetical protein
MRRQELIFSWADGILRHGEADFRHIMEEYSSSAGLTPTRAVKGTISRPFVLRASDVTIDWAVFLRFGTDRPSDRSARFSERDHLTTAVMPPYINTPSLETNKSVPGAFFCLVSLFISSTYSSPVRFAARVGGAHSQTPKTIRLPAASPRLALV